jgi:hypothetical protein
MLHAMDRATYLVEVAAAYQGEVRGEAMFMTLAENATNAGEREAWQTLALLEATTQRRMVPLMERHGLATIPDEEQKRRGRGRARDRLALGFAGAVRAMSESLPPYLVLYARLEAEGPAEDRSELAFLSAHEIALQQFATRTAAGDDDALAPVRALLGE